MNAKGGHDIVGMNRPFSAKTAFALFCTLVIFSCTTTKPADIDSQLTMGQGFEKIQEGLRIYVRPMRDESEIEKYFGENLLKKNILPVFVLAENKSGSNYFLVEPADEYQRNSNRLQDEKSRESDNQNTKFISAEEAKTSVYEKETGLEKSLILTGPIFWLAAIPIALADYGPTDASKSLQQTLITKSLRKQTLTPGKTESGFLYYFIPANISSAKNVGIKLKATNLDTYNVLYFGFAKEIDQERFGGKK